VEMMMMFLLGECLSRGACMMAGNFAEEGTHSYIAAIITTTLQTCIPETKRIKTIKAFI